jgi:hypothetical protein
MPAWNPGIVGKGVKEAAATGDCKSMTGKIEWDDHVPWAIGLS